MCQLVPVIELLDPRMNMILALIEHRPQAFMIVSSAFGTCSSLSYKVRKILVPPQVYGLWLILIGIIGLVSGSDSIVILLSCPLLVVVFLQTSNVFIKGIVVNYHDSKFLKLYWAGIELNLGCPQLRSRRQLISARLSNSETAIRHWLKRLIQEMLQPIDEFKKPNIVKVHLRPLFTQWWGGNLPSVADEVLKIYEED